MLMSKSIMQERGAMSGPNWGWEYPAGADTDPYAPFNQEESEEDLEDWDEFIEPDCEDLWLGN